jgi:periplasmic divalent cation tolerance protein
VEENLVACGQVLPAMTSIYRWQGQIHQDPEHLVLLKSTRSRYDDLEARLRDLHPYQEPEIIALPATQVSQGYLAWVLDQIGYNA